MLFFSFLFYCLTIGFDGGTMRPFGIPPSRQRGRLLKSEKKRDVGKTEEHEIFLFYVLVVICLTDHNQMLYDLFCWSHVMRESMICNRDTNHSGSSQK